MLDERVIGVLAAVSVATFVATLVIVPVVLIRMPSDYFVRHQRAPAQMRRSHPALRWSLLIGKNLLGGVLVLGGIAMLVMPGQGVLSILVGLTLIDFPGKFWLERKIVCRKSVHKAINWVRRKGNREPMVIPDCA